MDMESRPHRPCRDTLVKDRRQEVDFPDDPRSDGHHDRDRVVIDSARSWEEYLDNHRGRAHPSPHADGDGIFTSKIGPCGKNDYRQI